VKLEYVNLFMRGPNGGNLFNKKIGR
jgi:hypothetical protein